MQKIGFVSLGCPKNLVDSEVMMGQLQQHGYQLTTVREEADVMVVNTCGFIQSAKEESINTIIEMAGLKETAKLKRLVVAGCLVERYRQDLLNQLPEVDAVLGTSEIEKIVAAVDPAAVAAQDAAFVASNAWMTRGLPTYLYDENSPRVLATQKHFAYVKIAEGCDHTCAFCAIPQMRGKYRSRRAASLVREAEQLAAAGVKELVLISQDSTQYGLDLGLKDGLADLLTALARVDGIEWIRVMYTYPNSLSDATLAVMAAEPKVCSYLDMPLQHASAAVLKRMRRGGNRPLLEKLLQRAQETVPGIALRTTFIVGFPGETDEDFEELLAFVRAIEFDRVGVFTYSDEEGTHGFELDGKVPARVMRSRRAKLMREQAKISKRKNKALIGRRFRALLEGVSQETDLLLQARLESQAPEVDGHILINDVPEGFAGKAGDFIEIEITEAHEYDLVARIV
ncbi:MAG: 30S ribosomal protein S12 methylthiotransferase RimO [Acidobacteria bacterium]|nr:30S ribosomal protein S12 methylthiotransferase RimO [Acidobacteriota bacterium]MBI3427945.1 30S ribosomal protein S12 methylthiotransferase RimO [Acidobacteriota bacterium]